MESTVLIDERFRGPDESANGGYACAMAAQWLDGPAEVTLRAPPPLGRELRVAREEGTVALFDGETLIAQAVPTTVDVDVPAFVGIESARRAVARYPWRDRHPYPNCFVCGPHRDEGDGLTIFPGPVDDGSLYAATWTPEPSLADHDGFIRDEFVWGALDCPSGIVTDLFGDVGLILLGRLAADLRRPVESGRSYVLQAWTIGREGRKLKTASALFSEAGEICAVGRAVWIELPASPARP